MTRAVPCGERLKAFRSYLRPLSPAHQYLDEGEMSGHLAYYLDAYGINFQGEYPAVQYNAGYLDVAGQNIFCQFWLQPEGAREKGTIFVLHGYYDHSGLYGHVVRFFLKQGYSVFAFDEPGHGLSDGASASIDSFSSYTKVLRQCLNWAMTNNLPHSFHLFGQSMGGAVITELLVGERCSNSEYPFGQVILFAPLIRPRLWRWGRIQYLFVRTLLKSIPRSRSYNSHDKEFLEFLAHEPLQPKTLPVDWVGAMSRWIDNIECIDSPCDFDILIVQGQKDRTVDWRHNMPVYKNLYKSVDVFYLPEGQHHLVNECEYLRSRYFLWLGNRLL